ncbi:MAG: DUF2092 domain-containing protein [Bacteroidetes bacterium]|nr:DUF2092 domain-containing protein [Bacteroidota bacterium]
MNKTLFLLAFTLGAFANSNAQPHRIDSVAVSVLDHMSAMIGSLHSCNVSINSNYDISNKELGLIKHSDDQQLFFHGSDKMLMKSAGDKGTRYYFYNGKTFTFYSIDKNQYSQIPAPASVINMIDSVNKTYGIKFPAADFFYPGFVDDLISESQNLVFLGTTKIGETECFHIAGTAKDKTFQFWISDDAFFLPVKMVIVHTTKPGNPQYEALYSKWQINPELPDALFEFNVPPNSKKIKMIAIAKKK